MDQLSLRYQKDSRLETGRDPERGNSEGEFGVVMVTGTITLTNLRSEGCV